MKRNTFLIIISAVTIICIIAGSIHHLGFVRKNRNSLRSSIKEHIRNGKLHFDDDYTDEDWDDWNFEDEEVKDFTAEAIEEFEELDVKLNTGALKIERGNSWKIQTKYMNKHIMPENSVKNKKLTITQPNLRGRVLTNKNCAIIITVPFGTEIKKLTARLDVGAIELNGFDIGVGSVDTDVGAISITNVGFKELDLDSDVGAVSIDLIEPIENYDVKITSDLGGISIDGHHAKRKYIHNGNKNKSLRIHTDIGGIEVN